MKKIICLILVTVGLVALLVIAKPGMAASESGTVTGAARTAFTSAASFNSITLSGCDLGTGVFIEPDGSASGSFSAVLLGRSLLGQPQQIVIDGKVLEGAITPDGRAHISGIATINLGNGLLSLQGIPFRVTTATNSVLLTVGSTVLPAAQVTAGTISVE
jgi:hypothetical protein